MYRPQIEYNFRVMIEKLTFSYDSDLINIPTNINVNNNSIILLRNNYKTMRLYI